MQQLIICAQGPHRPDLLKILSKAIFDCGGKIADSHITLWGEQVAAIILLSGSWDAIVKIESLLPRLQTQLGLNFITTRTEVPSTSATVNLLPYIVELVALYHPQIVYEIANFFTNYNVSMTDLSIHRYIATTGSQMLSVKLIIYVPTNISIANLRNDFMDFCDDLNLDGIMDPLK